jgi:hypothetical protein
MEKCSSTRGYLALATLFIVAIVVAVGLAANETKLRQMSYDDFLGGVFALFGILFMIFLAIYALGVALENKENKGAIIFFTVSSAILIIFCIGALIFLFIKYPILIFFTILLIGSLILLALIDC